jgi:hypothetical protein
MTEPLPCHPDGHLEAEAGLRMEKGRNVVVLGEIREEPSIFFSELGHLFAETDSGCIHNC